MEIALLGGTGDIGEGLALRWGMDTDHELVIGSREAERAAESAEEYEKRLGTSYSGTDNASAAAGADVVVLAVPPQYAAATVETVAEGLDGDSVLVSPAVAMERDASGFHYDAPAEGSVAEAVAASAPEDVPVVSAFQNLAAGALTDIERELDLDVIVTGGDGEAKALVAELAEEIDGLRALDAGGLENSAEIESLTPLLINLAMNNDGLHDLGVRFQ